MPFVYSTMTASNAYATYAPSAEGSNAPPICIRAIKIEGGANTTNTHSQTRLGACTEVTDEELATLKKDRVFLRQLDRGFLTVEMKKAASKKVVKNLTASDLSAPLTPASDKKRRDDDDKKRKAKKATDTAHSDVL